MQKPKRSLLLKLAKEASQDFRFPVFLSIIFETITFSQIIAVIIKANFPEALDSIELVNFLKKVYLLPSIFGLWDVSKSDLTSKVIWIIFGAYISCLTLLIIGMTLMVYVNVVKSRIYKIMSILLLIHSRILYLPFHYFFLQGIHYYIHERKPNIDSFFDSAAIVGVSVFWEALNFFIGFSKEFCFYRITKTKNSYCSKTNTTSQFIFLFKAFVPLILLLVTRNKASTIAIAIFGILFSIVIVYTLYTKLPFYKVILLRWSLILASMMASFSIIGLFNSFISATKIIETILVVVTALLARSMNLALEELFERIIGGDLFTPEMAIHYPILLKKYTSKYTGLILSRTKFPLESIYFYSTFDPKLDDSNKLKESKNTRLRTQEFYSKVVEKIMTSRAYHKKSQVLLLYLSRIFMKKLEDASRALALIDKVKALDTSIPIKNSIESLQKSLQESYIKAFSYSDQELELANYFAYREEFNTLKESMQKEIDQHLEFWNELSQDDVSVKKVVDLADNIDRVYLRIKDRWRRNSDKFASVYPSSLLMYGLYLDTIRGLPQESMQIIQKFYNYNKNQGYKKGMISETSAIIIASLEKDKLGVVTDASNTVESLFRIPKDNLIGDKINVLMPAFVAKHHDWWMQKYMQNSMSKGIDRKVLSYGKTINDSLMGLEIDLKLYPFLDKGVNIMAYVKMTSSEDHSFIVKPDGTLAECPPKLTQTLSDFGLYLKNVNLVDVCPKFYKVNTAFNMIYGTVDAKLKTFEDYDTIAVNKNELEDPLRTKEDLHVENQLNTYNYTNLDTQADQGNVPLRTKNDETPLILLNEYNRGETIKHSHTLNPLGFRGQTQLTDMKTILTKNHTHVSEAEAKEICEIFKGNCFLRFQNYAPKFAAKRDDLSLEVTIEPYLIEGDVYKIVKVFDVQVALQPEIEVDNGPMMVSSQFLHRDSQFEQFMTMKTRSLSQNSPNSDESIPEERTEVPKAKDTSVQNLKSLKPRASQTKESDSKQDNTKKIDSLGLNHKEEFDNIDIRQSLNGKASSTKSYSHMDYKLIKTLHDFFGETKVNLMTRMSIYGVYLIMLGILVLSCINFVFTQMSLTEIDNGVDIVDTSSRRLTASLRAWQWMLLLYSRLIGLRARSSIANLLNSNVILRSEEMQTINNELRSKINVIGSNEIIQEIFSTRTRFYDPITHKTLTNGNLDIFTAVNILSLNNIAVATSTANDSELIKMNEPLMAINNTGNDFLVSSENQISQIEDGLQRIIDENISLLETILALENCALAILAIALIMVMRVVIKSYGRTFQALVRITPESVTDRVYKIKKFQTSLNENIEAKSFLENLNLYLNFFEEARDKKVHKTKEKKHRFFSKRYEIRGLTVHMIKFLMVSFVFILIVSGLFVTLFVQSLNSFSILAGVSDQLSVTNKLSYQASLVLSTFYFFLMFQNDTTMLIRNEAPSAQLTKNLDAFGEVNDELLRTLFVDGEADPTIEQFLQSNMCGYLAASIQDQCVNSTQGDTLGLLSFNLKYYKISQHYIDVYESDTSLANTKQVVELYFNDVTIDSSVLNQAYTFLTEFIMERFKSEVQDLETLNLLLSMGAVIFIVVATLLIQRITIKRFITLDNSQKKIYRTLTYYVFSQNKSVGFLLKKEFGGQIEGLNRILYV